MKNSVKWVVGLGALLVLFFIGARMTGYSIFGSGNSNQYDAFAQCLTANNVKMYGAFWCSHCNNQKKEFGESWKYVTYIECSTPDGRGQTPQCQTAGIQGYPTWEFGDGKRISGELSFEELALRSQCSLSQ